MAKKKIETQIFKQETKVESPVSKEMFLRSIEATLSSQIFDELINKEKDAIRVTVIMEVVE